MFLKEQIKKCFKKIQVSFNPVFHHLKTSCGPLFIYNDAIVSSCIAQCIFETRISKSLENRHFQAEMYLKCFMKSGTDCNTVQHRIISRLLWSETIFKNPKLLSSWLTIRPFTPWQEGADSTENTYVDAVKLGLRKNTKHASHQMKIFVSEQRRNTTGT